ncbi:hypothetical protein DNTS_014176 [Danionella cerebrum]|uniref:Uncharacterized protein n=1 Tax=Danionella cerebrum TaxID=2873325 RepID=A0A553QZQ9_9TELE|nr:hypothetical protein DNTS_014176 [Danionella translucida]
MAARAIFTTSQLNQDLLGGVGTQVWFGSAGMETFLMACCRSSGGEMYTSEQKQITNQSKRRGLNEIQCQLQQQSLGETEIITDVSSVSLCHHHIQSVQPCLPASVAEPYKSEGSNPRSHFSKESSRGAADLHSFISSGFVTLGRSHSKATLITNPVLLRQTAEKLQVESGEHHTSSSPKSEENTPCIYDDPRGTSRDQIWKIQNTSRTMLILTLLAKAFRCRVSETQKHSEPSEPLARMFSGFNLGLVTGAHYHQHPPPQTLIIIIPVTLCFSRLSEPADPDSGLYLVTIGVRFPSVASLEDAKNERSNGLCAHTVTTVGTHSCTPVWVQLCTSIEDIRKICAHPCTRHHQKTQGWKSFPCTSTAVLDVSQLIMEQDDYRLMINDRILDEALKCQSGESESPSGHQSVNAEALHLYHYHSPQIISTIFECVHGLISKVYPQTVIVKADPQTVIVRADPQTVIVRADPQTVIFKADPQTLIIKADLQTVIVRADPQTTVIVRADPQTVIFKADPQTVIFKADPQTLIVRADPQTVIVKADLQTLIIKADPQTVIVRADPQTVIVRADPQTVIFKADPQTVIIKADPQTVIIKADLQTLIIKADPQTVIVRADPPTVIVRADPQTVIIRADPQTVIIRADPQTVIIRADPQTVIVRADPQTVIFKADPQTVIIKADLQTVIVRADPQTVIGRADPPTVIFKADPQTVIIKADLQTVIFKADPQTVIVRADPPTVIFKADPQTVIVRAHPQTVIIKADLQTVIFKADPQTLIIKADPQTVIVRADPQTVIFKADPQTTVIVRADPQTVIIKADPQTVTFKADPQTVIVKADPQSAMCVCLMCRSSPAQPNSYTKSQGFTQSLSHLYILLIVHKCFLRALLHSEVVCHNLASRLSNCCKEYSMLLHAATHVSLPPCLSLLIGAAHRSLRYESSRTGGVLTSQTEPFDLSFSRSFQSLSHLPPSYESAVRVPPQHYSSLKRLISITERAFSWPRLFSRLIQLVAAILLSEELWAHSNP